MSTEARRASIPPRPPHPPRPSSPPGTASAQPDRTPPAPQGPPVPGPRDHAEVPPRPEQPPAPGTAPRRDVPARPAAQPRPSAPPHRIPAPQERPSARTAPPRPAGHPSAPAPSAAANASLPTDAPASFERAGANGSPGGSAPVAPPSQAGATTRPFRIGAAGARPTASGGPAPRPSGATATPASGGTAAPAPVGASDAYARGVAAHPRLDQQDWPAAPPAPAPTARFPDAPPTVGVSLPGAGTAPAPPGPAEGIVETTARLGPGPDTARRVISPRPVVSFAEPDIRDADTARPRLLGILVGPRTAGAAVCLVLGLGLIGGAVTGGWLVGGGSGEGAQGAYAVAGSLWHDAPVDQLFPPTVHGPGAGPGGADRTWTRVAVAPDSGCADAFDPLLRKALAPAGCLRLLRATYTDATRSEVTTVGLLFTRADSAAMTALARRFKNEGLDRRTDLMPRPYAAHGTVAAGFGDDQRASWTISIRTDLPVVVYAVSGFADGRTVTEPQPAVDAMKTGATTAPAQAGLGNEATGLADRIAAALRKRVTAATEKPS
ncbi:hypothetical protein [Streptomyces sp. NPDC052036]|uniref:hypothetical protein n=1 Tax=Streptomyces sp. NPDC052036 TaxID=3155171 RepID=UPI003421565A